MWFLLLLLVSLFTTVSYDAQLESFVVKYSCCCFQELSTAIVCQFRFEEIPFDELDESTSEIFNATVISSTELDLQPFECDEPEILDDTIFSVDERNTSLVEDDLAARMDTFFEPEDDDYETVEVCQTRNATRKLAALSTTNNNLVTVLNTVNYVQTIDTYECM
jgi:hypothetical protein